MLLWVVGSDVRDASPDKAFSTRVTLIHCLAGSGLDAKMNCVHPQSEGVGASVNVNPSSKVVEIHFDGSKNSNGPLFLKDCFLLNHENWRCDDVEGNPSAGQQITKITTGMMDGRFYHLRTGADTSSISSISGWQGWAHEHGKLGLQYALRWSGAPTFGAATQLNSVPPPLYIKPVVRQSPPVNRGAP